MIGWNAKVHGARGARGRHQLLPRRLPPHRHVRMRPRPLGDRHPLQPPRDPGRLQAALRGRGLAPPQPRGNLRPRGQPQSEAGPQEVLAAAPRPRVRFIDILNILAGRYKSLLQRLTKVNYRQNIFGSQKYFYVQCIYKDISVQKYF